MSNFAWIIVLTLILTVLGSLTLVLVTKKFYWGERGTPPPSKEERRRAREEQEARTRRK